MKADVQHRRRITTAIINEVLEDGVRWQKPPSTSTGRQGTIYYCAQVAIQPPTVVIFCNDPSLIPDTYKRYLEKHFRKSLGFEAMFFLISILTSGYFLANFERLVLGWLAGWLAGW